MPGLDRTGPRGLGAMTGRGLGMCGQGLRRGWNYMGGRMHRGWGRIGRPWTNRDEDAALEQEEKSLADELAQVRKERAALGSRE